MVKVQGEAWPGVGISFKGILNEEDGIESFNPLVILNLLVSRFLVFLSFLYPSPFLIILSDFFSELPLGQSTSLLEPSDDIDSSGLLQPKFFRSHINMNSSSKHQPYKLHFDLSYWLLTLISILAY